MLGDRINEEDTKSLYETMALSLGPRGPFRLRYGLQFKLINRQGLSQRESL